MSLDGCSVHASVTLVTGMIGVFSARSLLQQASFAALGSMGTLLFGRWAHDERIDIGSAVLSDFINAWYRCLVPGDRYGDLQTPGEGDALTVAPPFANQGLLASLFLIIAISVSGIPPLAGFVGKLLILDSIRSITGGMWLWAVVLVTSWIGIVGFASSGSQIFWKSYSVDGSLRVIKPVPLVLPTVSIGMLIACVIFQTICSAPLTRYLDATAEQLFQPQQYIQAVVQTEGKGDL